MKFAEEAMEILEAFDLTRSLRDAAELAGCSPSTVARYVELREAGGLRVEPVRRQQLLDEYREKVEEWVVASRGKLRADVAYQKLWAMGYRGSERTVRRAVAEAKVAHGRGQHRIYRPWVVEPGLWFQWDYGDGPEVGGQTTILFCAWLAWSRYRVLLPILDKALPTVIGSLDAALRRFGGCPTYGLTDNERTVTMEHVAGIPVRHPTMVEVGRHYGVSFRTCIPYDPESKGGSESTVRVAKADLVPTEANLLDRYRHLEELEAACMEQEEVVNRRPHRVTRRAPVEMLLEERQRLHPLPQAPYTAAFGVSRQVEQATPMVTYEGGSYSVPESLVGETVWARAHGEEVVLVHMGRQGPVEVARHQRTTPGNPRVNEAHFKQRRSDPLHRQPRAKTAEEAEFLGLGPAAALWLTEAAEAGASRVRAKMAEAVELGKLFSPDAVVEALQLAAENGRFGEGDLESILRHQATMQDGSAARASDSHSLQEGTAAWAVLGK